MSAARKKDLQRAKEKIRKEEQKRHKDKVMDDCRKEWAKILPKWESVYVSFLSCQGIISHFLLFTTLSEPLLSPPPTPTPPKKNKILPCTLYVTFFFLFSCRHKSRKVHDLWWHGLPPGIRGEVWKKAIGNDLNISTGERNGLTNHWANQPSPI